ncbi:MAG: gamma carbonic anhydrase family protein [Myxococcales bacterium]|nr:gamma carbonic anhydrase family protein [Myxococcales bacterium]
MALVRAFKDLTPRIAESCFLADNCVVIGEVELGDEVNVWYGAVLRGDCGRIVIGARTNVQDLTMIHMTTGISHTEIGQDVTVGHNVVIHGARIGDRVLVGMGSVILDNVEIGDDCLIAAGSVVPPRMKIPARSLVRGAPAKVIREVNADEALLGINGAVSYLELAREHRRLQQP